MQRGVGLDDDALFGPALELFYERGFARLQRFADFRVGTQTFTVNDISLGEPDARLFDMPSGYRMIDTRKPTSAAAQDSGAN